jgi:signal transduction histidine kinase
MRKRREIKRVRIIIYYILAIVLPCLILGVLAFRGIKNDQALVERELRNSLTETSQDIIAQSDFYISLIEDEFIKIIDSITPPNRTIYADSTLLQFSHNQIVTGVFFIPENDNLKLLNTRLLYVPDNVATYPTPSEFRALQKKMNKGWQYEFREKDYRKGLNYYQQIQVEVQGKQSEGEVLNVIARLQKKLKLDDDAIHTYDLIWNKYPSVYIQGKIPLGAVALIEKSLLLIKESDSISALNNIKILLNQIQKSAWEVRYSYYTFIVSQADKIISWCSNSNNEEVKQMLKEIDLIKNKISILETHTEYLLLFLKNEVINVAESDQTSPIQRDKAEIYTNSYFWSLFLTVNNGKWGLLFNTDFLLENVIQPLIIEKSNDLDFHWEILDESDGLLVQSKSNFNNIIPVYTAFPSNLPAFKMRLYPQNTGLLVSFFNFREGLFLYIYIAIIIILTFGLVFTLWIINNEIHFSKMKSYFMSTVSHEFKSPLTSIRQMAEMLSRGRVPSNQRKERYYKLILQQSERLSHLIENILDFSKMEENQKIFNFKKDNIFNLVKEAINSFQNDRIKPGIHISFSNGESIPYVVFDKEAMEQVMRNLLDNACKYSGDSKNVEVEIFTQNQNVVVNITDHGVGISKKDKGKIFDRFYRVGDELTQSVKGSGIGLTIVRQIVEAHNGNIEVESNPGKGSTFSVILPKA